ncbi:MAG: hypothetical protein GY853_08665 [PVC group bacterium]|nr:hypothetical protein [PVC group bacterium]
MQTNMMEYLKILSRRKQVFFYPFLIVVFIMVVLSFAMPKTYESKALILVQEEEVINPLISGLAVSTSVADRLRILREQILSWNSLTELVKRLKLDSEVKSALDYENLIQDLRESIIVQLESPQLVAISYAGREPAQVKHIVSTLMDIFIQQNIKAKTQETEIAVRFLEDQLKLYRRKIRENDIKTLQEQLDHLLVDSTEDHPLVKNLKTQISKLKESLDKGTDSESVIPKRSPSTKDKQLLSYLLLKELKDGEVGGDNVLSPELLKDIQNESDMPRAEERLEGLPLDVEVNQDIYAALLQRLETARITQQLESFKEGTRFTVIDPPRLPLKPTKPNKIKFLIMGIVLGAAVGYVCIYLIEMVDKSFKDINDAKADLKYPVLGAISLIITDEELQKKKQTATFTYSLMAIVFFLMVGIVLAFSFIR